jgi:hypothetical protein
MGQLARNLKRYPNREALSIAFIRTLIADVEVEIALKRGTNCWRRTMLRGVNTGSLFQSATANSSAKPMIESRQMS